MGRTAGQAMRITRAWAMPSRDTFTIAPIADLLDRWLAGRQCVVDPFARNSKRGHCTNDLNPNTSAESHLLAEKFIQQLVDGGIRCDAFLFDPPYSPRQISEVYHSIGHECSMRETQNGRLYKEVKDAAWPLFNNGAIAICCGWSGCGFGEKRGFVLREMLIVVHGGAHNATIVTVEEKVPGIFGQATAARKEIQDDICMGY
jgi:hypothetical protein